MQDLRGKSRLWAEVACGFDTKLTSRHDLFEMNFRAWAGGWRWLGFVTGVVACAETRTYHERVDGSGGGGSGVGAGRGGAHVETSNAGRNAPGGIAGSDGGKVNIGQAGAGSGGRADAKGGAAGVSASDGPSDMAGVSGEGGTEDGGQGGQGLGGGSGGGGGAIACALPCAATAFCSAGTCKSRFTEYAIGMDSYPGYITSGADGNLWFATGDHTGGVLGRLTVAGTPTLFPILSAAANPNNLTVRSVGIVLGPDHNIWFDAVASDGKAYISKATADGQVTNYLFSMTDPTLGRVTVGPDGNMWAAIRFWNPEAGSNKLEICTPAGSISEKTLTGYPDPYGIVAGPDGNMWFTESDSPGGSIGRLTLTGTMTEFPSSSSGQNITVGADNNLWFTEPYSDASNIGRYTPAGTLVEFPVPTASSSPWDITKGPDGNVWFTEIAANNIGSITPGGQITEYPTPATPYGITTGPDGNIWFTEPAAGKIVRFVVP